MQVHSDVEQQNYYLKIEAIAPSGILHQLSLSKGGLVQKKEDITISKKTKYVIAVFCFDLTAIGSYDFVQIRASPNTSIKAFIIMGSFGPS